MCCTGTSSALRTTRSEGRTTAGGSVASPSGTTDARDATCSMDSAGSTEATCTSRPDQHAHAKRDGGPTIPGDGRRPPGAASGGTRSPSSSASATRPPPGPRSSASARPPGARPWTGSTTRRWPAPWAGPPATRSCGACTSGRPGGPGAAPEDPTDPPGGHRRVHRPHRPPHAQLLPPARAVVLHAAAARRVHRRRGARPVDEPGHRRLARGPGRRLRGGGGRPLAVRPRRATARAASGCARRAA